MELCTPNVVYKGKFCGAVIVAAGSASRMGGIDKALADLGGAPVLAQTVKAFQCCSAIGEIAVVTRQDILEQVADLCAGFSKVRAVVVGGADRTQSVLCGLRALSQRVQLAAIHDGARPLITPMLIEKTVEAAQLYGAAAPAVAVKDTIKVTEKSLVSHTPNRGNLKAVQTPQIFDKQQIILALKKALEDGALLTDDCSALERLGIPVFLVDGQEQNMKITTAMDLKIANLLWEEQL